MSRPEPEQLRDLAAAVDAAPSVVRRSAGALGTAAAYLPGERIPGLRLRDDDRIEVHVVMRWGATVDELERDVLVAIGDRWDHHRIDLVVEDIALTGTPALEPAGPDR